jgi:hypothetical protein
MQFIELSHYHKEMSIDHDPQHKKSFIQSAQGVVKETNVYIKAIQPLLDECTDQRLKAQLSGTVNRIGTLAQQLKIVAAVKASNPRDTDKGVQLITATQNLVASIKNGLRDCIACSIRSQKGSSTHKSAVQFKKIVYARQLLAAGVLTPKNRSAL